MFAAALAALFVGGISTGAGGSPTSISKICSTVTRTVTTATTSTVTTISTVISTVTQTVTATTPATTTAPSQGGTTTTTPTTPTTTPTTTTPLPSGTRANLFVDDTAGSCVRSATPADYSDGSSCSLAGAYAAAQSGDLILVRCASGASCGISGASLAGSQAVTIQGMAGYTVKVGSFNGSQQPNSSNSLYIGASNLTVRNLTIDNFEVTTGNAVTLDSIRGQTWRLSGGTNTTISNGDFSYQLNCGGTQYGTRDQPTISGSPTETSGGTIVRNTIFHDNTYTNCSSLPHLDCLQISSTRGTLLDGDRFFGCPAGDDVIVGDGVSGILNNITIQNSWFGPTVIANGPQEINFTPNNNGVTCHNVVFRYNTILTNDPPTSWGSSFDCGDPIQIYGNIIPEMDDWHCGNWSGQDFHNNVGLRGSAPASCGTGSKVVTQASVQFANVTGRDYHIGPSSSVIASGDPANCPAIDIDGQTRISPCDAGADEVN
jgi:hypothetical protein